MKCLVQLDRHVSPKALLVPLGFSRLWLSRLNTPMRKAFIKIRKEFCLTFAHAEVSIVG